MSVIMPDSQPTPSPARLFAAHKPLLTEILLVILDHVDSHAILARFARASRSFYLLATPILYKFLFINLEADVNPLVIKGVLIDPIPMPSTLASTATPLSDDHTPLPNRFTYVQYLTVSSHFHHTCRELIPLIMPNLTELHILPSVQEHNLDACLGDPPTHTTPSPCPLLSQLRPTTLVFGSDLSGLTGSARGLWPGGSPAPPPYVTQIIILVGHHTNLEQGIAECTHELTDGIPPTVRLLTLVVGSGFKPNWANGETYFEMPNLMEEEHCGVSGPELRREGIARACAGNAAEIEIYGLENIRSPVSMTEAEKSEDRKGLRAEIVACLVEKGVDQVTAGRRAEAVVFYDAW